MVSHAAMGLEDSVSVSHRAQSLSQCPGHLNPLFEYIFLIKAVSLGTVGVIRNLLLEISPLRFGYWYDSVDVSVDANGTLSVGRQASCDWSLVAPL